MITIEQEIENYKQAKAIAEKLRIWRREQKMFTPNIAV